MSRRRSRARDDAVRLRVSRAKVLRRGARRAGARRAATAAAVVTVTAAVVGAASVAPVEGTGTGTSGERARGGDLLSSCGHRTTPSSQPGNFVDVGGTVFFTADDGAHGRELWKSDGTRAGTVLVRDINPGADDAQPEYGYSPLVAIGETVFFSADDRVHGRELWKSDGTRAGTVLVKDIHRGKRGPSPTELTKVGDALFFSADDGVHGRELWRSDGTQAGTVLVRAIDPAEAYGDYDGPVSLTAVGGRLFFAVDDGTHGMELWQSDGTRAGTVLVKDIRADSYGSYPDGLAFLDDTLFFTARDGTHGSELWKSDGTEAGTVLVKDIRPGAGDSQSSFLTAVEDQLFFSADDGVHGQELWKSDGTEAGTVLVKAVDPDDDGGSYYSGPKALGGVGGVVFFDIDDGVHGRELWKSDGTEAGTVLVKDIRPGPGESEPLVLRDVDGTLFFGAADGRHGWELWKSDGTEAGTVLVKDIDPGAGHSGPVYLTAAGDTVFLSASDGTHGSEVWRSDGTRAGTTQVRDINLGGGFEVAAPGHADTRRGTVDVGVVVEGAGRLLVRPAGRSRLKGSAQYVATAGRTTVTLKPTRAGMRKLTRTGKLPVNARFTFTPCRGPGTSIVHRYTLKLR
jgi:ELWxxDGT repeat protein